MNDFELSGHDKVHPLWMRLKAHLEDRLASARRQNDRPQSEAETALLRGEIKALNRIIALGDDRPLMTGDEEPSP